MKIQAICINPYGATEEHPDHGFNVNKGEEYTIELSDNKDDIDFDFVYVTDSKGNFIEKSHYSRWQKKG